MKRVFHGGNRCSSTFPSKIIIIYIFNWKIVFHGKCFYQTKHSRWKLRKKKERNFFDFSIRLSLEIFVVVLLFNESWTNLSVSLLWICFLLVLLLPYQRLTEINLFVNKEWCCLNPISWAILVALVQCNVLFVRANMKRMSGLSVEEVLAY